jgi:predicted CXXCH cytochrome family protein
VSVLTALRRRPIIQKVNLTLLLLLAILALLSSQVLAEEATEHPFIEQKDIKSETCLGCHPEKKQGKFVHSAVGMGCENCHQATSEKNKTTITLVATGDDLCAMCHKAKKDPVQHGPYKNGRWLTCHDPHTSEFKAQTRAAVNSLCLACHALQQVQGETVTLFSTTKISKADFEATPKIELDPTLRFGHPWVTHPVAQVADPLRVGEKMSCLSCHTPHASAQENLIVSVKGVRNVCIACHQIIDERAAATN